MEFRPCIDIHNGKVKQIVGGSLQDQGDQAKENFVAEQDASFYAEFYKKDCIQGGHVILLNSRDSEYYEKTKEQAMQALKAYPGGLQIGGGICAENAAEFDAYVAKCKELSLYDTGVSAEYGDKLISLSTCEYSRNNGRLVVVAKRVD